MRMPTAQGMGGSILVGGGRGGTGRGRVLFGSVSGDMQDSSY